MKIFFTGATSSIGLSVLESLLSQPTVESITCGVHRKPLPFFHPKLKTIFLDIPHQIEIPPETPSFDLCLHFGGVTHSHSEAEYWKINRDGTMELANKVRENGCRRFLYISTFCAVPGAGAYGESKLEAERYLQSLEWDRLIILRPSEIYGAQGKEGVDRFLHFAAKYHFVPMLFGNRRINFSPIHIRDFVKKVVELVFDPERGSEKVILCGPEKLSGITLALRIAKEYKAVPFPLWFPMIRWTMKVLKLTNTSLIVPDQISRLICQKPSSSTEDSVFQKTAICFLK